MSNGHRWSKFWWQDWQNDDALRACCLAAQGLWMRILCIAHNAVPYGHLLINGKQPTDKQLAAITGASLPEIKKLMTELEEAGVFSRKPDGTIYCRRMERDALASDAGREWGKAGGNPSLNGKEPHPKNHAGGLTPPLNPTPYPTPLTEGVGQTLNGGPNLQDTDSESEAEDRKEKKVLNFSSQGEFVSPREAELAPIAAETEPVVLNVEAAEAAAAVIAALGKTMRRPAFAACPFPGKHSILKPDELAEVLVPRRPKPAYLTPEQLRATRKAAGMPVA